MPQMLKLTTFLSCILLACSAHAQTPDPAIQKLTNDQTYCYGLAGMANMSVLWRNSGKTLEEQLDQRKKSLGEETPEYALVRDITKQVYDKDIKDPRVAMADTHASCLDAKGHTNKFLPVAIRNCPVIGTMVGEVAAARKQGATLEQISAQLGDRFGSFPKTYGGGVEKIAAKYSEDSKPETGLFDYQMCMIKGMSVR